MQPPKTTLRPPSTAETLSRIEAKLDRLERVLGPLSILAEAPNVAGTAMETIDDMARGQEVALDSRVRGAVELLERVSRPETLAMLGRAVDIAESLPGLLATAGDTIDDLAGPGGADLHGRLEAAMVLLGRMTHPDAMQLVGQVVVFLRHAQTSGERRIGVLGLLKALRDPNTQRAVGFAMSFLEAFGQALEGSSAPKQLRS